MFAKGDKVLCTSNLYRPNLMGMEVEELIEEGRKLNFPVTNGDIGVIEEIFTLDGAHFGKKISYTSKEIPEVYRNEQFLKVYSPLIKIAFEGKEGYTWFNTYDTEKLSLGYVFTVHKAQGSEYENLVTFITSKAKGFITPKMLYTAMTRAKEKLFLVISQSVLEEIFLLSQKDVRYTIAGQIISLLNGFPFSERHFEKYPAELKEIMRIYFNWMFVVRKRYNNLNNTQLSSFDFILKIIHSNIVDVKEEEEDSTDITNE